MGTSLITAPTAEPVTLAEARARCRVTHALDDAHLAALILSAREWAQGVTRRAFMPQTWDYTLHAFPRKAIELPMSPVSSVTSVKYYSGGVEQTFTDYTLDLVSLVPTIRPVAYWPETDDVPNAVTVRFVAGYPGNHPDLLTVREAMLLHVEAHYDRDADNFDRLLRAADNLLEPLRVVRV